MLERRCPLERPEGVKERLHVGPAGGRVTTPIGLCLTRRLGERWSSLSQQGVVRDAPPGGQTVVVICLVQIGVKTQMCVHSKMSNFVHDRNPNVIRECIDRHLFFRVKGVEIEEERNRSM